LFTINDGELTNVAWKTVGDFQFNVAKLLSPSVAGMYKMSNLAHTPELFNESINVFPRTCIAREGNV
jgi:hypothetical protein